MTNCLFFGDSITFGEHDYVYGGYVDILRKFTHYQLKTNHTNEVNCFNLGIGGETTEGLLKRYQAEIKARICPDENLFFFGFGANDLAEKNNFPLVELQLFEKNMKEVVTFSKNYTNQIYLISILPISDRNDNVVMPSGKLRSNEKIMRYNESLKQIASDFGINYIDIYIDFYSTKEVFLSEDGVHPNEKGYQFMAEFIKPIIENHF